MKKIGLILMMLFLLYGVANAATRITVTKDTSGTMSHVTAYQTESGKTVFSVDATGNVTMYASKYQSDKFKVITSFVEEMASYGSGASTWIITNNQVLSGTSYSVPANVSIHVMTGASLYSSSGSGTTINFYGPVSAGTFCWLNSAQNSTGVTAVFHDGSMKDVSLEWWGGGVNASAGSNNVALERAKATNLPIILTGGTYNFSTNQVLTNVPLLKGIPGRTVLKATDAVTGTFFTVNTSSHTSTGSNYQSIIDGVGIEGFSTTGVTGIQIASSISGNILLRNVEVYGFTTGLHVNDVVNLKTENCIFAKNGSNVIAASAAAYPTMVRFTNTQFRESSGTSGSGRGLYITHGYNIVADGCVFESNDKEGLYIATVTGYRTSFFTTNHWFENNQASESAVTTFYHAYISSNSGYGYTEFKAEKGIWSLDATTTPKLAHLNYVQNFQINEDFSSGGLPDNILRFANVSSGKLKISYSNGAWKDLIVDDGTNVIDVDSNIWTEAIANSQAPSVVYGNHFESSTTPWVVLSNFAGGYQGKKVDVHFWLTGNTVDFTGSTVGTTSYLLGNSGVSWYPNAGDWMECSGVSGAYVGKTLIWNCIIHDMTP